jgi:hypothetical protein
MDRRLTPNLIFTLSVFICYSALPIRSTALSSAHARQRAAESAPERMGDQTSRRCVRHPTAVRAGGITPALHDGDGYRREDFEEMVEPKREHPAVFILENAL